LLYNPKASKGVNKQKKKAMKKLFGLLSVLLLAACNSENPGSVTRYFYEQSEVSPPEENVGMYVNWTPGNKIVFRFVIVHPDDPDIADDEVAEVFWVEVPKNLTAFEFDTNDIGEGSDIEVYYTRSCYCGFEAFRFNSVEVTGKKRNNGSWHLSFKMTAVSGNYTEEEYFLEDDGIYVKGIIDNSNP
tara:strand:+ start:3173 stop:3733 length:561 start_codon:yes stop_codon:yes gene_type:complete